MQYENLDVWQRSYALTKTIYLAFRDNRDFGFKDQITRSALSVPSNIAEGWERFTDKEKFRFLSIAKGSAGELKTQLMLARDIGYLPVVDAKALIIEIEEIAKMLGALMRKLNTN
ncbi:four helix bundle protein [Neptunicella marina]|uniref:Four helix bundle protein n=1 Tax=Neptunicella marina TaxID=2125989 RepID=A0A8J6M062_9ALTE|nr:four helix bundle protein [Neptunicella marina]MBC3764692.1 four helix bundle protein [Neptunicella marina]